MRKIDGEQFLWLIGLSIVASATALFVDETVYAINGWKLHYRTNYLIWMSSSLLFAGIAQACIQYISPLAQGSGIPQMKAIMAGVNLPGMLSTKTYISKVIGMVCMLSSGMSLGKEGPFVHIAGCIANSLPYRDLRTNKTLMHQFLTAAVAVGVTCTFGAPIGGVLFSIEVSTTSFTVSNLWKSFFASTVTVLCFKSVGLLASAAVFSADASYFYSGVAPVGINHEQPFFVGLGITCGILGTMYIQFQKKVNTWKKNNMKYWCIKNNWCYTLTMTFLLSNCIYFTRLMQTGDKAIIRSMIDIDQTIAKLGLSSNTYQKYVDENFSFSYAIMEDGNKWVLYEGYIIMFLIMKMLFTALTLSCPIPGGIFTPTFAMGAVIGQLYVSILLKVLAFFEMQNVIQYRGVYSILGAAAMTGSVTRTVSVAMIVLELNGHLSHACPLMVCVLCSYAMSEYLKPQSFFEMLSELGGLDAKIEQKGKIIVKDFLSINSDYKKFDFLSLRDSTEQDIIDVIKRNTSKTLKYDNQGRPRSNFRYIPVVDSKKNMNLLYMVNLDELRLSFEEYFGPISTQSNASNKEMKLLQVGNSTQLLNQSLIQSEMMENKNAQLPNVNICRFVILQIRHIAPPVLYSNSPLSYIASGAAQSFYQGEGEATNDSCEDPSVIVYWIIETTLQEVEDVPPRQLLTTSNIQSEEFLIEEKFIYGNKLIGFLPCSDSFGVDLILENYQKDLAKKQAAEAELETAGGKNSSSIHEQDPPKSRKFDIDDQDSNYSDIQINPSNNPENLNDFAAETTKLDKSQRSSAGFMSSMPLRVTTKGEEIQLKEAQLISREQQLAEREAELQRLLGNGIGNKFK